MKSNRHLTESSEKKLGILIGIRFMLKVFREAELIQPETIRAEDAVRDIKKLIVQKNLKWLELKKQLIRERKKLTAH